LTNFGKGQPLAVQGDLLVQLLQALAYLHRRGIIHRDLKPDNALVIANGSTSGGQIKVLDFGLAVARDTQKESDTLAGTLAYMAPEVLMGKPASEASDLYAAGVMAYEMFAGRHPFDVDSPLALVHQIFSTIPNVEALPIDERLKETLYR